jgi:hypothetical protein
MDKDAVFAGPPRPRAQDKQGVPRTEFVARSRHAAAIQDGLLAREGVPQEHAAHRHRDEFYAFFTASARRRASRLRFTAVSR